MLKQVSRGALAFSFACSVVTAGPIGRNEHMSDQEVMDSIESVLGSLSEKVESTRMFGGSSPVEFQGVAQFMTNFYRYSDFESGHFVERDQQSLLLGEGKPVLQLNTVIKPGRNTRLWLDFGLNAGYRGHSGRHLDNNIEQQHHNGNKGFTINESLCAGIAMRTRLASFMLKGGAMNWEEHSPLSLWNGQARMFAWEYMPYELENPVSYHYLMNIAEGEREGRSAWNKRPFQGIAFQSERLPGDIDFSFVYGVASPYTKYDRTYLDAAVHLNYAADEDFIFNNKGYSDDYHRHLYYRLSKTFRRADNELILSFNNGYTFVDEGIMNLSTGGGLYNHRAKDEFTNQFNDKFQIGGLNTVWEIQLSNGSKDTVAYNHSSKNFIRDGREISLLGIDSDEIEGGNLNQKAANIRALTLGEGYWIEPRVFSIDGKGRFGDSWSYHFDLGVSIVDTQKVTVLADAYEGVTFNLSRPTERSILPLGAYENVHRLPASSYITETVTADPAVAAFANVGYAPADSAFRLNGEFIFAAEGYNAPHSFINSFDAYYALGSNMVGPGNFVNGVGQNPYSQNSAGAALMFAPTFRRNLGHFKVKYGFNRQINPARDILFFPYRLNGAEIQESMISSYSRYGSGLMTQPLLDSMHNPSYVGRLGDESFSTFAMGGDPFEYYQFEHGPQGGGLRGDYLSSFEGFVAYSEPHYAIMNLFAASSDISQHRDLSSIWDSGEGSAWYVDRRDYIKDIRVVRDSDTLFYTLDYDDRESMERGTFIVTDSDSNKVDSIEVSTVSESGFVPVHQKQSFNAAVDWGMDFSKIVGYPRDLFLSLYYEISGISRGGFSPFSVDSDDDDVLLVSHYIRSEPAIAVRDNFYILGLLGWERWHSSKGWVKEYEGTRVVGIKQADIETVDKAIGIGFDWDMARRVSLHGRYKRFSHEDKQVEFNNFTGNHVKLELKAFF